MLISKSRIGYGLVKLGHHGHGIAFSRLGVRSFTLLVMFVAWASTSIEGIVDLEVVGSEGPRFADGKMVGRALKTEVATIKTDLQEPSEMHECNDFGMLPVRTALWPFDDHGDGKIATVSVTVVDKLDKVVPYFVE
jgi:hypothetical protein